jgi:hypothetical protein
MSSVMELSFIFDSGNSLIRATLAGPFSLSDSQTTFARIVDALVEYQAKKVLIDGRAITGQPETLARFYYGEFAAEEVAFLKKRGVSYKPQFAYVILEPVRDKNRFGETIAKNRGMHVMVFDNLAEAEKWLQITPSPAAPQS